MEDGYNSYYSSIITRYRNIITDNIKNPRDVTRFINLFMPKYEKIEKNVDFHDFLMLSLIRYNYYSEYRDLYDGDFIEETVEKNIEIERSKGNSYQQKQIPVLYLKTDIDDILKRKFEGRKDREKDNFKKLLEELFNSKTKRTLFTKETQNTYDEQNYESCIKFKENFDVYFQVFVADETNDLEFIKKTNVLSLKNIKGFKDYLQRLLKVNKREIEQSDRIRELIFNDSTTSENLRIKIGIEDNEESYKDIIFDEFKKIPPLNILADFVNDKENKIILEKDEISEIIKAEVDMNMIEIQGGEFTMMDGSKAKKVKVDEFKISRFQVTQELYRAIMSENPSHFNGHNLPVERVSWYDAVEFCNKLSALCGRKPYYRIDKETKDENNKNDNDELKWTIAINKDADGFRLPTEAQWEYAAQHCRKDGVKTTEYAGTEDRKELKNYAWYYENSGDKELDEGKWNVDLLSKNNCRTHTVGTAPKADELKIHDMSGNVWEWCWDWYGEYDDKDTDNPVGASTGSSRVLRGGSWDYIALCCRVSNRYYFTPDNRYFSFGFRLVLVS